MDASKHVGFWSALTVALLTVWFMVAFGLYTPAIMSWQGVGQFAQAFRAGPYVAWVLPCLLLALAFPILGAALFVSAEARNKTWATLGLVFATMYGAIAATDYWLLLTVVREGITGGPVSGVEWLIVGSPHSVTNTIEGIGYAFMGLAFIFQAFCFPSTALGTWIRVLLLVNGTATVLSVIVAPLGLAALTWVALAIWGMSFPVVTVLEAVFFRRRGD